MEDTVRLDPELEIRRRWTENGMEELIIGFFALTMGGIYLLTLFSAVPWLPLILCALAMLGARRLLSNRLIFPRTGYVVFRPQKRRVVLLWVLCAGCSIAGLGGLLGYVQIPHLDRLMGVLVAAMFGFAFTWGGVEYRMPRYLWFAALTVCIGTATYLLDLKIRGTMWVMVGVGAMLSVSGAFHMIRFVRTHPVIGNQHG